MIARLTGIPEDISTTTLTLDVHDVGYQIFYPSRNYDYIIQNPSKLILHIYTHVREDQITLFGFLEKSDRAIFMQLITVSGVGPKLAMSILSKHLAANISQAITTANVDFFTGISGLGKKTSQKIIVELKNKLGSLIELDLQETHLITHSELIDALTGLGYSNSEITPITKQIDPNIPLTQQIKAALNILKKQ